MKSLFTFICLCLLAALPLQAEEKPTTDRISFNIAASMDVENDRLVATVFTAKKGKKTQDLAEKVNQNIEWGLALADTVESVNAQTLNYSTSPHYDDRKIVAWEVRQSIQLKSADSQALSQLLGQLQEKLQISSIEYRISDERQKQKEDELIAQAIADFKQRAKHITDNMGRKSYKVVRMNISNASSDQPYMMEDASYRGSFSKSAAPPLKAGNQEMTVNIQAEIELLPES